MLFKRCLVHHIFSRHILYIEILMSTSAYIPFGQRRKARRRNAHRKTGTCGERPTGPRADAEKSSPKYFFHSSADCAPHTALQHNWKSSPH
uniref:Putative secreted protein n=1 Tax=Ixodes ricinus TaxID=34613 RepID=A0A6B0UB90_IXORI